MRRSTACLALALILVPLQGCETMKALGVVPSDPNAERAERLRLPPDLSAQGVNDRLAVPGSGRYSDYQQSRDQLTAAATGVDVRKAGGQRWLEVQAAPGEVWRALHNYLKEQGLTIARESRTLGVIETEWVLRPVAISRGVFAPAVKDPADASVADHYQFRVEPGEQPDTSEVYVVHRRMAQREGAAEEAWGLRPGEPFLEAEMLRGLMVFLGTPSPEAIQQIAKAEAAAGGPTLENNASGELRLVLSDSFFNGWRRIGVAIDRLGFSVEDRDRSQGEYFVRYDPKAELGPREEGLLDAIAFWRKKQPDSLALYVIKVRGEGGETVVDVRTEDGAPAPAEVSERVLALLSEQLRE